VWFGVAGRLPAFGWTWRRCTLGGGGVLPPTVGRRQVDPAQARTRPSRQRLRGTPPPSRHAQHQGAPCGVGPTCPYLHWLLSDPHVLLGRGQPHSHQAGPLD